MWAIPCALSLSDCYFSNQIYQTSGMILRPDFYENATTGVSRHDSLIEYGLDPSVRTALVFWGGVGSSKVVEVSGPLLPW